MKRFNACFRKNLVESLRDWKILIFAIFFAPCFVFILYSLYGQGNRPFRVAVVGGVDSNQPAGFLELLRGSRYDDGKPHFLLESSGNEHQARRRLESRSVDAVLIIPEGFDAAARRSAADAKAPAGRLRLLGDPRFSSYVMAAICLYGDLERYCRRLSSQRPPAEMDETLIGQGAALTEFDMAVPGIIVFGLLNVTLTAGAAFLREVERKTIVRLTLSRLTAGEFVGSITLGQALICTLSMALALISTLACGFQFKGTIGAMIVICALSSLGVVGVSLFTAAFLRSVHDLLTVGVVPYFVIMFFSGVMFPPPRVVLFRLGSHALLLHDLLPLAASVTAFNKVMNYGAPLTEIVFELVLVVAVSGLWLAAGLWLFKTRQMELAEKP